jgi:hypothetical protein
MESNFNNEINTWIQSNFNTLVQSLNDIFNIFLISVPLSLLLYLIFAKYKKWIVVDLGNHKWLIK